MNLASLSHVGCILRARLIGLIEAEQTEDGKTTENDRLIAVAVHSYSHENVHAISELNPTILPQVEQFFISYNKSRGKKFKIKGGHGPGRAVKRLEKAAAAKDGAASNIYFENGALLSYFTQLKRKSC